MSNIGTGVRPVGTSRNFSQGNLNRTENPLDLAINGNGFLQVQMPDGTTSYTRDGALRVDSQGQMVTANGYPLNPAITIPANSTNVTIGADGVVTALTPGNTTPVQVGTLQTATFVNPAGLDPIGQNLFRETAASGTPAVGTPCLNGHGTVSQGYVETSNVNVVEELVSMIQTQRAYEINSKAISTSDQMLGRLSQL
jgi:flagellar basal-body rod protein FlgG